MKIEKKTEKVKIRITLSIEEAKALRTMIGRLNTANDVEPFNSYRFYSELGDLLNAD